MHRLLAGCGLVILTAATALAQGKGNAGRFGWHGDFNSAKAEARRTGKPIFLVFRCEP